MNSYNIKDKEINDIYPEVFFRRLVKKIENEAILWPDNLEVVISGVNFPIIDGKLKESYFQGEESHLFLINLYNSNKSSFQMEETS